MGFDHTWKLASVWVILIRQIARLSNKALQQHHSVKLIPASAERHLPASCGRAWRMQQMRSPGLKQPAVTIHTKRPALHSPMGPTVKCTTRDPRRGTSALPPGTGVRVVALQGEECEKRLYLLLVSQHFCRLDSAPSVVEFSHRCSATHTRATTDRGGGGGDHTHAHARTHALTASLYWGLVRYNEGMTCICCLLLYLLLLLLMLPANVQWLTCATRWQQTQQVF